MGKLVKIGDKLVELDERGMIKATSKEIRHPDGRVDIEIHVPSLKIVSKNKKGESHGLGDLQSLQGESNEQSGGLRSR